MNTFDGAIRSKTGLVIKSKILDLGIKSSVKIANVGKRSTNIVIEVDGTNGVGKLMDELTATNFDWNSSINKATGKIEFRIFLNF